MKQIAKSNVQNLVIIYVDLLYEEHVSFLGPYLSVRIVHSMCGKVPHKDSKQTVSQSTTILSIAQLTPRKHEVCTELVSVSPWQAKLRQDVAHAADNCQHGSLMCYDHHVGTNAAHLEFNCPQSATAKSDSLQ